MFRKIPDNKKKLVCIHQKGKIISYLIVIL